MRARVLENHRISIRPSVRLALSCAACFGVAMLGCSAGGGTEKHVSGSGNSGGELNLAGTGVGANGTAGGLVIGVGASDGAGSASGPCDGGGWRCKVADC